MPTAVPSDIATAQTAASLENLTLALYTQIADLASVRALRAPASTTIAAFVTRTLQQHTDHLTAFNAAARRLGGPPQTAVDEVLMSTVVQPALADVASAADALALAAKLELIAAQTYAAQVASVSDAQLRRSLASIAGVEAQHQAVLLTLTALLSADTPELVTFPVDPRHLVGEAGSAATPTAFLRTDQARPATEGAVR